ncbi:hypothetical protein DFS34DRAFT_650674 [Phlyctochytrium arcticum]|nr:hypothetical protein DFS34DRAFT_650674 [Phlyctochytrium arcticum]
MDERPRGPGLTKEAIDKKSSRRDDWTNKFTSALEQVSPENFAAGKTYEFPAARLPNFAAESARDQLEMCLIAFFNLNSLLNRQAGGLHTSYTPNAKDVGMFQQLGTSFFGRFNANAQPSSPVMVGNITNWISSVKGTAQHTAAETRASLFPMSDPLLQTLQTLQTQAKRWSVHGHTILVLIGKDITRQDYIRAKSFLRGGSRAGFRTAGFLARLAAHEIDANGCDWSALDARAFPFVDLYPWQKHTKWLLAAEQLAAYLQASRPLISITFSQEVLGFAKSNFYHQHGLDSNGRLLDHIARRRLEFCQSAEGRPGDSVRQRQVNYLWKLAIPSLLIHLQGESAWKEWAMNLQENTHYFPSALRQVALNDRTKHRLKNILAAFAPQGAEDDEWMNYSELRKQAIDKKVQQLLQGLPSDHFSAAKQSKRRLDYLAAGGAATTGPHKIDKSIYHADWHNREVRVRGNGAITVRWYDEEKDQHVNVHLRVPSSCGRCLETDKRFIHFLPNVIGLVDEQGDYLTKGPLRDQTLIK